MNFVDSTNRYLIQVILFLLCVKTINRVGFKKVYSSFNAGDAMNIYLLVLRETIQIFCFLECYNIDIARDFVGALENPGRRSEGSNKIEPEILQYS